MNANYIQYLTLLSKVEVRRFFYKCLREKLSYWTPAAPFKLLEQWNF